MLTIGVVMAMWGQTTPPAADIGAVLGKLVAQYRQAQEVAKQEAAQRDQLALQAQSAIIRMKDAEIQMEKALGSGRSECALRSKVLVAPGNADWRCEDPPKKEIQKK